MTVSSRLTASLGGGRACSQTARHGAVASSRVRKSTLSEPRNAWTNPAETEVLPRLSPGGPLCSQKSEPVYSFVSGRPERSSGDRQIIWRRWRRQHIHTRATLLRPVHVLDHHSQRTPPPSACAAEAGGCWLLSSADQSALQLTVQPARRDAAAGEEMVSVQSPGGPGTRLSREADEHRVHSHHREGQQRPAERGERWQPTPPAADDASAAQHQREEQHR